MQLTCLRSKSILYTLLRDVRAGFCKQGFLASGFLLLCDKGGTTENYRAGGERRKEFLPPFLFSLPVWAVVNITRASFLQSGRGTSFSEKQLNYFADFPAFAELGLIVSLSDTSSCH